MVSTPSILNDALDELKQLSAKLNQGVDPLLADVEAMAMNANQTLKMVEHAAQELAKVGDPRSPILLDLRNLVHETQITSRALKDLTDDLKRNPNTLLRGKESSP